MSKILAYLIPKKKKKQTCVQLSKYLSQARVPYIIFRNKNSLVHIGIQTYDLQIESRQLRQIRRPTLLFSGLLITGILTGITSSCYPVGCRFYSHPGHTFGWYTMFVQFSFILYSLYMYLQKQVGNLFMHSIY